MEVIFEKDTSKKRIEYEGDVQGLLKELGINPEVVIVARGDTVIELQDKVSNDDTIMVISVVSGG